MIAVAAVIIAVVLSILIARIATVALTVTGLSRESARFQARAAITNTGLTTREAERSVNHPVRRRILMTLMILGKAGIVTVVSTVMLSFVGSRDRDDTLIRLLMLIGGLLAVLALASNNQIDRALTRLISKLLARYTNLESRDYAALLKLAGDYTVTEMVVGPGHWLAGAHLGEKHLPDEGIIVLGIERPDGSYVGVPRGDTPVGEGDQLILYGRVEDVAGLNDRVAGTEGDAAHELAVAEHRLILNAEALRDPRRSPPAHTSSS